MMTATYAPIGSVSSDTMRPEDLIPAFISALDDIKEQLSLSAKRGEELEAVNRVAEIDDFLAKIERRMEDELYYEGEEADHDLDELFEKLDEFAPPYCYFGAHEGDGACYGFWVSWDAIEDGRREGIIFKIDAGDEWMDLLPEGTEYVLEVNDHGNAALYAVDGMEIWSVA